jgi:uncharacterized protein
LKGFFLTSRPIRWLAYLGGWTLFALFFISEDAGRLLYQGRTVQWHGDLVVWLTTAYAWAFLAPFVWWLAGRFPIAREIWWRSGGLHLELADDVLAAVRFLRLRSDIDPDQIGIEGDSEGGWIAPAVATRDQRIKFIVIWGGPAMDYVPELMNEVEENAEAAGLSGDELMKALEFKRQALKMLADGAGLNDESWAKFQAFDGPYRKENWFSYVSEPEDRSWFQKKLYLMAQTKSSDLWRQVKIPVLALYGGKDLNVPAAKNVAALNRELTDAGNRDFAIKVFPNANHDGFETTNPMLDDEQARYLTRLVPGLVSTQLTWVLAHLGIKANGN